VADDVTISAGTGTTIAADELTINAVAAKVQRIKVVAGKDGTYVGDTSGRLVDGDTNASALFVDPRPLVVAVKVTPTISTTPAYTAKDAVGALMTFTGVARANGGSGRIVKVTIEDKGQQMKDLDLVVFNVAPAAPTDNAIFAPSDAELSSDLCEGVIALGAGFYADFSTNSIASVAADLPFKCASGSTSITGVLVARGTPTYTSTTDLVVTILVVQD